MKELRCPNCNKLLLKAVGECIIEIKCPRCNKIINLECQK
jgi:phage FluMu protein Com